MGSFITIGFVCDKNISKSQFLEMVKNILLMNKDKYDDILFKFPIELDGNNWNESVENQNNLSNMLDVCFENDMAQMLIDYQLNDKKIKGILLRIERLENDSVGFCADIPENNFGEYKNIDLIEQKIESELKKLVKLGFSYAFCDNEVYLEYPIDEVLKNKNTYSILVINNNLQSYHSNWKIDGLSPRNE